MATTVGEGLSRVTIVAPGTRMDLALPSDVPLADLLPTLLRYAGEDLADDGATHGGWALRRLGGPPLDTGRTVAELDIHDGEMLYLTPRADASPEVVFDDVVDAVATATRQRADRWVTADTRRFAVGFTVAALAGGIAAVLFAGPPHLPSALVGTGLGLVLLVTATLVSRVGGDSRTGTLFGLVGLAYGGTGGLLLLAGDRSLAELAAPDVLLAATFLVVYGAVGTLAVGDYPQVFLGAAALGVALGVGAGICLVLGAEPAVAAAVVGTVSFATVPAHPILAYRLARLPMPSIPTDPEDLRRDVTTVDGRRILALSERAAEYLTGLTVTVAVAVLASVLVLVLDGGLPAVLLAALLAVLLMLRARPMPGRSQRLPVLVCGALGLGAVTLTWFATGGALTRLGLVLGVLLAAAVISLVYGLAVAGKRISPLWGRTLDILEILMIVAVVPVAAWAAGLYGVVATIGR